MNYIVAYHLGILFWHGAGSKRTLENAIWNRTFRGNSVRRTSNTMGKMALNISIFNLCLPLIWVLSIVCHVTLAEMHIRNEEKFKVAKVNIKSSIIIIIRQNEQSMHWKSIKVAIKREIKWSRPASHQFFLEVNCRNAYINGS